MKILKVVLTVLAMLFGLGLVLISLKSSMPVAYPTTRLPATQRQFYLSTNILPDHLFYPILMTVDRVQLQLTPSPDRLWLQAEYGWRRLDYTYKLLQKGETSLALTTLLSHKNILLMPLKKF